MRLRFLKEKGVVERDNGRRVRHLREVVSGQLNTGLNSHRRI